jgi:hypothetical protein
MGPDATKLSVGDSVFCGPTIRAGLIDLTQHDITEFSLDEVNDAVTYAAANAGPLRHIVLRPDRRGRRR